MRNNNQKKDSDFDVNEPQEENELDFQIDEAELIEKTGFPEKLVFNADEDRVLTYLKNKHPDKF